MLEPTISALELIIVSVLSAIIFGVTGYAVGSGRDDY